MPIPINDVVKWSQFGKNVNLWNVTENRATLTFGHTVEPCQHQESLVFARSNLPSYLLTDFPFSLYSHTRWLPSQITLEGYLQCHT